MMNKRNIVLHAVFGISTVLTIMIFYKDMDHPYAYTYLVGYVLYLLAYMVYMTAAVVVRAGKMKGTEIKKRVLRFIGLFISLGAGGFAIQYFLQPQSWSFYDFIYPALGASLGLSFFDLAFYRTSKS